MVNLYLLYMRRCTLCMGLHSYAFFIDIENMILPPSSSLWALIPCRHTQINTHAYTNGWRKVWWKKHNIFLSLPGSWVIFILNARKLVSLSFYAPLSGFYLPFTSRALCSLSPSASLLFLSIHSLGLCESEAASEEMKDSRVGFLSQIHINT